MIEGVHEVFEMNGPQSMEGTVVVRLSCMFLNNILLSVCMVLVDCGGFFLEKR